MASEANHPEIWIVRQGMDMDTGLEITRSVLVDGFEIVESQGEAARLRMRVLVADGASYGVDRDEMPRLGDVVRVRRVDISGPGYSMRRDIFRGPVVARTITAGVGELCTYDFEAVDEMAVDHASYSSARAREIRERGMLAACPAVPAGMPQLRHEWVEITTHENRQRIYMCRYCAAQRTGDPLQVGDRLPMVDPEVQAMVRRRRAQTRREKEKPARRGPSFEVEREQGRRRIRRDDLES